MSIQMCSLQDRFLLQELAEKTFRETYGRYHDAAEIDAYIAEEFSIPQIERELSNPSSLHFISLVGNEAAGYIKLNYAPAQTDLRDQSSLELQRIYVLQQFQGHGNGQELLEFALAFAKKESMDYLWLGVWMENARAIRFYQKNGFYQFGTHHFVIGRDIDQDYLMRKDL